jgi:hypothetical protein
VWHIAMLKRWAGALVRAAQLDPLGPRARAAAPHVLEATAITMQHSKSKTSISELEGGVQPMLFSTRYRYRLPAKAKAKANGRGRESKVCSLRGSNPGHRMFTRVREDNCLTRGNADDGAPSDSHIYTQNLEINFTSSRPPPL